MKIVINLILIILLLGVILELIDNYEDNKLEKRVEKVEKIINSDTVYTIDNIPRSTDRKH